MLLHLLVECNRCKSDNEQYCAKAASTYNAPDVRSNNYVTQGGYSSHSIADEQFVFPIQMIYQVLMLPLMCAGITVFSPLLRNLGSDAKGKLLVLLVLVV